MKYRQVLMAFLIFTSFLTGSVAFGMNPPRKKQRLNGNEGRKAQPVLEKETVSNSTRFFQDLEKLKEDTKFIVSFFKNGQVPDGARFFGFTCNACRKKYYTRDQELLLRHMRECRLIKNSFC